MKKLADKKTPFFNPSKTFFETAAPPLPIPSFLWRRHVVASVARSATVERRMLEGW